jgi:hypothetical protein
MKHFNKPHAKTVIGLLVVDLIFFSLTDPLKVPSVLLIVAFLLFTITLYLAVRQGLKQIAAYGFQLGPGIRRLSLIVTGVISGLLALQSIGQLSSRDIWVLMPLALLTYLYVSYGRSTPDSS